MKSLVVESETKNLITKVFTGKRLPMSLQLRVEEEMSRRCSTPKDVKDLIRSADKIREVAEACTKDCPIDYMQKGLYDLICVSLECGHTKHEFEKERQHVEQVSIFIKSLATIL